MLSPALHSTSGLTMTTTVPTSLEVDRRRSSDIILTSVDHQLTYDTSNSPRRFSSYSLYALLHPRAYSSLRPHIGYVQLSAYHHPRGWHVSIVAIGLYFTNFVLC